MLNFVRRATRWGQQLSLRADHFVVPVILSVVASALEGLGMVLLVPLFDAVIRTDFSRVISVVPQVATYSPSRLLLLLVVAVVAVSFTKNLFLYLSGVAVAHIARLANHNLRRLVFNAYVDWGKQFFDQNNLGYLNQVLVDYTTRVTRPLVEAQYLLTMAFSFVVYVGLMLYISWRLTVVAVVIFVLMYVVQRFLVRQIHRRSHALAQHIRAFGENSYNVLATIGLVKAYTNEAHEKKRFAALSRTVASTEFIMGAWHQLIHPLQDTIATVTVAIIVVVAFSFLTIHTSVSSGLLVLFFYTVLKAASSLAGVYRFRGLLAQVEGPLQDVRRLLVGGPDKHVVPEGELEISAGPTNIEFRSLTFSYGELSVLQEVTFPIESGRMVAIVGATGSGKSTVAALLVRFYDCPPNTIFVNGIDIRRFSRASLLRKIAYVSQEPWLFNDSVRANVAYGLSTVTDEEIWQALSQVALAEDIRALPQGLSTRIGDRGVQLSGGQKQRLALARAILKKADVLILDEATSALDSTTEAQVQAALQTAMQERTAIVIAHRLSTIMAADQVIVLEKGKVVERGAPKDLLARSSHFANYWRAQQTGVS